VVPGLGLGVVPGLGLGVVPGLGLGVVPGLGVGVGAGVGKPGGRAPINSAYCCEADLRPWKSVMGLSTGQSVVTLSGRQFITSAATPSGTRFSYSGITTDGGVGLGVGPGVGVGLGVGPGVGVGLGVGPGVGVGLGVGFGFELGETFLVVHG
jgi:hypothetical protein